MMHEKDGLDEGSIEELDKFVHVEKVSAILVLEVFGRSGLRNKTIMVVDNNGGLPQFSRNTWVVIFATVVFVALFRHLGQV